MAATRKLAACALFAIFGSAAAVTVEELPFYSSVGHMFNVSAMVCDDRGIYVVGADDLFEHIWWSADGISWTPYIPSATIRETLKTPWEPSYGYADVELTGDRVLLSHYISSIYETRRSLVVVARSSGAVLQENSASDWDCPIGRVNLMRSQGSVYVGSGAQQWQSLRRFDSSGWTAVGPPLIQSYPSCDPETHFCICHEFTAARVWAIAESESGVLVAGNFGPAASDALAELVNGEWDYQKHAADATVDCLVNLRRDVVALGNFTQINGVSVDGLARYDGTGWSPLLPDRPENFGSPANLYVHRGLLYIDCSYTDSQELRGSRLWVHERGTLSLVHEFQARPYYGEWMIFGSFQDDLLVMYQGHLYRLGDLTLPVETESMGNLKSAFGRSPED